MSVRERQLAAGDPLRETAMGTRGVGARHGATSGQRGRRVKDSTKGRVGSAPSEERADGAAVTSAEEAKALTMVDAAIVKLAASEVTNSRGVFAGFVKAVIAWLQFKPSVQDLADRMDAHGMIEHRVTRKRGVNKQTVPDDRPSRASAQMTMDLAKFSAPQYLADDSKGRKDMILALTSKKAWIMPDKATYASPLAALESGKYTKSTVYQTCKNLLAPVVDLAKAPRDVAKIIEGKALALKIPVRVYDTGKRDMVTKDATGNREASLTIVKTLLTKWAGTLTDADRDAIMASTFVQTEPAPVDTPAENPPAVQTAVA